MQFYWKLTGSHWKFIEEIAFFVRGYEFIVSEK